MISLRPAWHFLGGAVADPKDPRALPMWASEVHHRYARSLRLIDMSGNDKAEYADVQENSDMRSWHNNLGFAAVP
jgi:hypothetical protein